MKVVLLERVERLGSIGDVVAVKDGFARNFLLPKSKALRATSSNLKLFEVQREQIEAKNAAAKSNAERVAERLDGKTFVLIRQAGEGGQLYGSVTSRDIVEAALAESHVLDRGSVVLAHPIKTIGLHPVRVKLHAEVSVTVHVNVARSQDEAERQARGEDIVASQFQEERKIAEEAAADLLDGGAGSAMANAPSDNESL